MPDCPFCKFPVEYIEQIRHLDVYADSEFGEKIKYNTVSCKKCGYMLEVDNLQDWNSYQIIISKSEYDLMLDNGWKFITLFPLKIRKEMLTISGDYEVLKEITKIKQKKYQI